MSAIRQDWRTRPGFQGCSELMSQEVGVGTQVRRNEVDFDCRLSEIKTKVGSWPAV